MRIVLTAAAFAAVFSMTSANAESTFVSGGPVKQGNVCQVNTNGDGMYGYVTACPTAPAPARKRKSS